MPEIQRDANTAGSLVETLLNLMSAGPKVFKTDTPTRPNSCSTFSPPAGPYKNLQFVSFQVFAARKALQKNKKRSFKNKSPSGNFNILDSLTWLF